DPPGRAQRIRELESLALKTGQTQIFIETPYRNAALLQGLVQTLQANTRLALSCGITLGNSVSRSALVSHWKRDKPVLPLDLPTVFCIGR
ncbi:MAG: putative transrane protein, partial [Polaromonas sp.]|nr:putative transrane protein [Polaromonas sp.]